MGDFATLTLEGSGLARRSRVREAFHEADYLERFDAQTLWLDAVWRDGVVRLICPRLTSLRGAMRGARFALDGRTVRARVQYFDRHSVVTLRSREVPLRVSIEIGGWRGETRVHAAEDTFAGCNVLVTLSKDNDPAWIEDWVRYHVVHHGADAVLFVDNGSAYGPEVVRAAIQRGGVAMSRVLVTDAPYGPRGKKPYANAELFLQFCVLNAVRHRFLWNARAVLNCDIDELVTTEGSIFDTAVDSRFGYLAFPGYWVHPEPGFEGYPSHRAHGFRDAPKIACPDKWCMVPNGPLRHFEWRQHRLERLPFPSWFRGEAGFWHCRNITNGWKLLKRTRVREATVPDGALQQAVAILPERDSGKRLQYAEPGKQGV
ncbi:hypothetical protein [Sagittula salina]|uniref:Uncharacterized protein n=1 Tax=Sagittula salina TaxID=2820268 RepID=A0A940MPA1_9RHOB|nr:hypothetical protein [Sagittula salina]MBP0482251.1 hypothetical protein [Sagittula salina]